MKIEWNLVFSILTALGFFEIIKQFVQHYLKHDLFGKNHEIRKTATRVQKFLVKLRCEDFKNPISGKDKEVLILDVMRIADGDKAFTTGIMQLINIPVSIKTHRDNSQTNPEEAKTAVEETRRLYDLTEDLNKKCNYYRKLPLFDISHYWNTIKPKLNIKK